eukprot:CAMPEP_0177794092 /NCGR_PEP_ID=MMETSP0491_2-20121128/25448_1 /TAXON_ID=63592 /ORGANISM="Tetraselmis chuii, Strain PLY429" /LENGTH=592 /DNA_ID=CAMNT_0019316699 /DNA_START=172 /DNA_END=1951 /DNA_ORIENTATION=-
MTKDFALGTAENRRHPYNTPGGLKSFTSVTSTRRTSIIGRHMSSALSWGSVLLGAVLFLSFVEWTASQGNDGDGPGAAAGTTLILVEAAPGALSPANTCRTATALACQAFLPLDPATSSLNNVVSGSSTVRRLQRLPEFSGTCTPQCLSSLATDTCRDFPSYRAAMLSACKVEKCTVRVAEACGGDLQDGKVLVPEVHCESGCVEALQSEACASSESALPTVRRLRSLLVANGGAQCASHHCHMLLGRACAAYNPTTRGLLRDAVCQRSCFDALQAPGCASAEVLVLDQQRQPTGQRWSDVAGTSTYWGPNSTICQASKTVSFLAVFSSYNPSELADPNAQLEFKALLVGDLRRAMEGMGVGSNPPVKIEIYERQGSTVASLSVAFINDVIGAARLNRALHDAPGDLFANGFSDVTIERIQLRSVFKGGDDVVGEAETEGAVRAMSDLRLAGIILGIIAALIALLCAVGFCACGAKILGSSTKSRCFPALLRPAAWGYIGRHLYFNPATVGSPEKEGADVDSETGDGDLEKEHPSVIVTLDIAPPEKAGSGIGKQHDEVTCAQATGEDGCTRSQDDDEREEESFYDACSDTQ